MKQNETESTAFRLVAKSIELIGRNENFFQGASFSPDGLCVLTNSVADSKLRVYNADQESLDWKEALSSNAGDTVRSYAWYPKMNSADPASCCFLAAIRYVLLALSY